MSESNTGIDYVSGKLKALAKKWPKDLWIYCADGRLYLMQEEHGERMYTPRGGVDPDYCICSFKIPSDGGDW